MKKVLLTSLFICLTLFAETNTTIENLNFRDKITNGYHKFLNSIDCYLTNYDDINQSNYKKISKNKLYVILSIKDTKEHALQNDLHIKARIKLPQLQDKFEITFSKQAEVRRDNQNIDREYDDVIKDTNLHVGLKYYAYKEPYSDAYAKISFRFHSPMGLYAKIGVDKSYFYKKLQTTFNHALYYYINDKNYAASTSVMFFVPLYDRYGIEQKNRWYWKEEDDAALLEYTLRFYHDMDVQNKLHYQLTYATIDDKTCNYCQDWYGAHIKFRHYVTKWFFFEFIPEILKRRENHFEYEKVFTANFGLVFSK